MCSIWCFSHFILSILDAGYCVAASHRKNRILYRSYWTASRTRDSKCNAYNLIIWITLEQEEYSTQKSRCQAILGESLNLTQDCLFSLSSRVILILVHSVQNFKFVIITSISLFIVLSLQRNLNRFKCSSDQCWPLQFDTKSSQNRIYAEHKSESSVYFKIDKKANLLVTCASTLNSFVCVCTFTTGW